MAWKTHILVVANVTADSEELLSAMRERSDLGPTSFTLVLPPRRGGDQGRDQAQTRLEHALDRARERGIEIDGALGHGDPMVAVSEAFDPRLYDEIFVSTLPVGSSRWLQIDLPHRIARLTGVPVRHVVGHEPRPRARSVSRPAPPRRGVLSPLTPLTWGGREHSSDHAA